MGTGQQALLGWPTAPAGSPSPLGIDFMAGAEHESASILKWPAGGTVPFVSGVAGAFGRVYDNALSGDTETIQLSGDYSDITVGFRIRIRTIPGTTGVLAQLLTSGNQQVLLIIANNASLRLLRISSQVIQATAASYLAIDTWYTIMWRTRIDNTNGQWEVRIIPDGGASDTPLSGSTGDTQSQAGNTANQFRLGDPTADTYSDEGWVEITGATPGYCRVETLVPTGAGGLTQLTRGGADSGANWSQVDELPANSDTDYVVSTGSNQSDSYALANRSITGTPLAVQLCAEAKFASAGTRQFKLGLRIGGTVYEGSITHTLTSTYAVYREVWNNNPATGNAWTDGVIDGMEPVIVCLHTDCRITEICAEVLVQI